MAYATLAMKDPLTGSIKYAPAGISWVSIILGPFVPLFRGDIKWFIFGILIWPLFGFIFLAIKYNKIYIKSLLKKGYKVQTATMPIDVIATRLELPQLNDTASPSAATKTESSMGHIESLQKLAQLKESGVLTDQEFEAQKKIILAR